MASRCLENLCTPKRYPIHAIQENKQPENVTRLVVIGSKNNKISRWLIVTWHTIYYSQVSKYYGAERWAESRQI